MAGKPIFISARFRSGSTLLWNIFRSMPGSVAYYEPCHEHLLAHVEADIPPRESHINAPPYWEEYKPIQEKLRLHHKREFGLSRLYMEAEEGHPELVNYIRFLIDSAGDRTPVLQFNRMDFRLEWLRANFPEAKIIHLERNPRENWYSMVNDLPENAWKGPLTNTPYDLVLWSIALHGDFPFLFSPQVTTTYHRHYLLWRLSSLVGKQQADISLSFEKDLVQDSERTVRLLVEEAGLPQCDVRQLTALISPPAPEGWREFADPEWFGKAEEQCDKMLEERGLVEYFGKKSLSNIKKDHHRAWSRIGDDSSEAAIQAATQLAGIFREEQIQFSSFHKQTIAEYVRVLELHRKEQEGTTSLLAAKDDAIADLQSEIDALRKQCEEAAVTLCLEKTEHELTIRVLNQTRIMLAEYENKLRKRNEQA